MRSAGSTRSPGSATGARHRSRALRQAAPPSAAARAGCIHIPGSHYPTNCGSGSIAIFLGERLMADKDAATPPPGGAAGDPKSGQSGVDRAKGILAELAEAMRTVAEALADEQRARSAGRVAAVAAAVRGAAQSLAQSEMPTVAHCAGEAADRIEDFSAAVRERRWRDI